MERNFAVSSASQGVPFLTQVGLTRYPDCSTKYVFAIYSGVPCAWHSAGIMLAVHAVMQKPPTLRLFNS